MKKIVNGKVIEFTEEEIKAMQKTEEEHKKTAQYISIRINELKQNLFDTDYHILKVVEGSSTLSDCFDIIKQRRAWRAEINELEAVEVVEETTPLPEAPEAPAEPSKPQKKLIVEDKPEYDIKTQWLKLIHTETDDTITISWEIKEREVFNYENIKNT